MTLEQQKWLEEHPGWRVVTAETHHKDYARACNGAGPWKHDRVLCGDGRELPGDSMCIGERIYVRPPRSQWSEHHRD